MCHKFPIHYALFFFYEKKGVPRESLSDRSCFEDKNFQFLSSKQLRSKKKSFHRAHFERSEKRSLVNLKFVMHPHNYKIKRFKNAVFYVAICLKKANSLFMCYNIWRVSKLPYVWALKQAF